MWVLISTDTFLQGSKSWNSAFSYIFWHSGCEKPPPAHFPVGSGTRIVTKAVDCHAETSTVLVTLITWVDITTCVTTGIIVISLLIKRVTVTTCDVAIPVAKVVGVGWSLVALSIHRPSREPMKIASNTQPATDKRPRIRLTIWMEMERENFFGRSVCVGRTGIDILIANFRFWKARMILTEREMPLKKCRN